MKFKFVGPDAVDIPTLDLIGVQPGDVVEAKPDAGLDSHPWFEAVKPAKDTKPAPTPTEEVTA